MGLIIRVGFWGTLYDTIITINDTLIIIRSPQKSIGNNFRPFYSNFGLGTGSLWAQQSGLLGEGRSMPCLKNPSAQ